MACPSHAWDVEPLGFGWSIRCTFRAPDRDSAEVTIHSGRWWVVERDATETDLVKTAWLALRQVVEHELMESFLYRGVRLFDPHRTLEQLAASLP